MDFSPIYSFFDWVGRATKGAFDDLWELLGDAVAFVFEKIMDIAITASNALDLSALAPVATAWTGLPPEAVEVLGAIGITQALSLIVAAIGVRIALQLIPFTRLGS